MGDLRSWAAEKEDEVVTCEHGVDRYYFDTCLCKGCVRDREFNQHVSRLGRQISSMFEEKYKETPEAMRDSFESRIRSLLGRGVG